MSMGKHSLFNSRSSFELAGKTYHYYRLESLKKAGLPDPEDLPYTIKILLESLLRQYEGHLVREEHVVNLANWETGQAKSADVPCKPARVILQDFTGVPAVVDLASLRKAVQELNGDPDKINPEIRVELVIDHSIQVDKAGTVEAMDFNLVREFQRNRERYKFLRWAQGSFSNFSVIPPGMGIIHQVNLEYLTPVVHSVKTGQNEFEIYPDFVVGTDSHTTMINCLALGWGVGGVEAEACLLGQPSYFPIPEVIGVRLKGALPEGASASDLALTVTEMLRAKNVVGKFVEFYGPGLKELSLADRATVANMAPEYGATCGFFPIDRESLDYLKLTGRSPEQVRLIEAYCKINGLFYEGHREPKFTEIVELDLAEVQSSLAGPKRPQDRISLLAMQEEFKKALTAPRGHHGFGLTEQAASVPKNKEVPLTHGSIVIAAITSCTNTSNPFVMLGAGLIAKRAAEKGLKVPKHVKTSLTPGSRAVTGYLKAANLLEPLEKLGFAVAGYGCATCIGNSGPLQPGVEQAIGENDLVAAAVVSANRNFEGRVHPLVKANYLASPMMVVAYALAGTVNFDLQKDSFGLDQNGQPVYLADLWPSSQEVKEVVQKAVKPEIFIAEYANVFESNERWNEIERSGDTLYNWDEKSTYIQNPPFFAGLPRRPGKIAPLNQLSVLAFLGDSVTTDHISPAGAIGKDSPAGAYLVERGVRPDDFNSYGSRRGNHEVMVRGTFANVRIANKLAPGMEGGYTTHLPSGEVVSIYDAAMRYKAEDRSLMIIAGRDYGMGSSRDWAAKGPYLLGVKAVLVESFERIHRSNLVMMGILPLQFVKEDTADRLELTGQEMFSVEINDDIGPNELVRIKALDGAGRQKEFWARARFDSDVEIDYYRHGGILQMVLRQKLAD